MRVNNIRSRPALTLLLATALLLSLAGCARPFPSHITDQVDRRITYADLSKDPEGYKGKWVMFGGSIVGARTERDGRTFLEILQKPVDRDGRPYYRSDETGGRFMAVSSEFMDPAIYRRGRLITVVGEVVGESVRPIDQLTYRYPLLAVQAVHLWEPNYGPRVSIGVGVGVFHRF